ncbi:hypothetical protein BH23GEM9_BH23GEM9_05330 [soil metagenome]
MTMVQRGDQLIPARRPTGGKWQPQIVTSHARAPAGAGSGVPADVQDSARVVSGDHVHAGVIPLQTSMTGSRGGGWWVANFDMPKVALSRTKGHEGNAGSYVVIRARFCM